MKPYINRKRSEGSFGKADQHIRLAKSHIYALKHRHSFLSWFIIVVVFALCVNVSFASIVGKLLPYIGSV